MIIQHFMTERCACSHPRARHADGMFTTATKKCGVRGCGCRRFRRTPK